MEIIRKTNGLTAADLYALTKGNDVRKLSDAKGEILEVQKIVQYADVDANGNSVQVLSMACANGAKYATNSKTFIRNFSDICAIFEEANEPIPSKFMVGAGRSHNNREYLTCDIAE